MDLPIHQIDAFTSKPFAGNPAAVCLLSEPKPDEWMQLVAQEMNLSETAFLLPGKDGYQLRWFTPRVEVDLCGHATLASAHFLFSNGYLKPDEKARFYTRSGELSASIHRDWIELDFPSRPPKKTIAPQGLLHALGIDPLYVGENIDDILVEVTGEDVLRGLSPDFQALEKISVRGIILTSRATSPGYDFVSRFFAPAVGIDEDPVTGSAHTCLTPYWSEKLGKLEMVAYQASRRGGEIRVSQRGDRVFIRGQAVTIFKGVLIV